MIQRKPDAVLGLATGSTPLGNRACFSGELRRVLADSDAPAVGCVGMLRIADLATLNQHLGRARTDEWLMAVGKAMQASLDGVDDVSLARVGGADFAVCCRARGSTKAGGFSSGCRARRRPRPADRRRGRPEGPRGADGLPARRAAAVLARVDSALMRAESIDAGGQWRRGGYPDAGAGRRRLAQALIEGALARQVLFGGLSGARRL